MYKLKSSKCNRNNSYKVRNYRQQIRTFSWIPHDEPKLIFSANQTNLLQNIIELGIETYPFFFSQVVNYIEGPTNLSLNELGRGHRPFLLRRCVQRREQEEEGEKWWRRGGLVCVGALVRASSVRASSFLVVRGFGPVGFAPCFCFYFLELI